ncbi:dehydrogenase/reductase SDR family member on chromosome X-like [Macrosteles quadrilineatus]|uniref:dehydrogenase/reductase SDR family member on chromosome X-like n=1 Tax=Macrosteles quadrilineatus TaxID=74068 RepID=UPI0023E284C5|nr:dehydrogenase/reductase SDR family member on chromosome X-like [Macrosteles quadrilineatus]
MIHLLRILFYPVYYYFLGTFAIIEDIFLRRYNKCELKTRSGDVAVITGGARGIGAAVVKKLLQCEMHVVIGCRNVSAGSEMVRKLRAEGITSGSTSILPLDMASLDSVTAFATAVLNSRPKVHLLINNAGIMFTPYEETVDGFESQWAVNYLGHFLLCHLLLRRLHETAQTDGIARIVNVTSCAHHAAYPIDYDNINMKYNFITQAAYAQSKAAQLMFTLHLDRALRKMDSQVRVVAVHPGIVNTDLFNGTYMKIIMPWAPGLLFKSAEEGATTVMFAALHAKGGDYISNARSASISKLAQDQQAQVQLFNHSKRTLGILSFGGLEL